MAKKRASKKKAAPAPVPAAPEMPAQAMPQAGMPGMMPQAGMGGANPMMQMMQMMQMMAAGGTGMPMMDPAAVPFAGAQPVQDDDAGLDEDFIRPALLDNLVKSQESVPMGCALDVLCLNEDGTKSLGGIPRGCTIAFAGPPGKGKTRSALAGLCQVAAAGEKGWHLWWRKKDSTIRTEMGVMIFARGWSKLVWPQLA